LLWSEDNVVRVQLDHGRLFITTEAKKNTGGVYFLDKQLTGITRDFYKRGGNMVAEVYDPGDSVLVRVIGRLQTLGAVFVQQVKGGLPPTEKLDSGKPEPGTLEQGGIDKNFGFNIGGATELGPFAIKAGVPLGEQAQAYVLSEGRRDGVEYLLAVDEAGHVIANSRGQARATGLTLDLLLAMMDERRSVVIHHNHPNDTSLSVPDLAHLSMLGLSSVWAHGHDGTVSRAQLTVPARAKMRSLLKQYDDPKVVFDRMHGVAREASRAIIDPIQNAVYARKVPLKLASKMHNHLVNRSLHDAGVIDYQSNFDAAETEAFIAKVGLAPYLKASISATRSLFYGSSATNLKPDRPTKPLRHPGDVGATFDRARIPAGQSSRQEGDDRGRAGDGREEEGGGGLSAGIGVRRRAPQAGDLLPLPETVRDAWDPTVPFRQRLSDAVDALLLTPSRALWDKHIDIMRFQKAAEAMGRTVGEPLDVYLAATLYPGKVGERMKDVVRDLLNPVYDAMAERKIGRDEMHDFLYARHAPERNAQIRTIDPANMSGSGMTDADAAATMASLAARRADFDHVAALFDKVIAHNRDTMLREGLETQATINNWMGAYDHYVPLKGWETGSDDVFSSPSAGAGSTCAGRNRCARSAASTVPTTS
jgi:hypothetical protein